MRRPLLKQAIIIARRALSPARIRVIRALVRQNQDLLVKGDNPIVVVCHAGSLMADGDILWRRPEASTERSGAYSGPPADAPAPPGWHPELHASAPLPRELPAVDDDAVDVAEREAARFTFAIGGIALVMLVVLICWRVL